MEHFKLFIEALSKLLNKEFILHWKEEPDFKWPIIKHITLEVHLLTSTGISLVYSTEFKYNSSTTKKEKAQKETAFIAMCDLLKKYGKEIQ